MVGANIVNQETLQERINWAISKPEFITQNIPDGLSRKDIDILKNKREVSWGSSMINSINNKQWTTKLGEELVRDVLINRGKNPIRPVGRAHFRPDWETDEFIYEVKTRTWTTSGTAGEKVLGTPYKYADIPILYGKPLKIVCVAYQEHEFSSGNTRIFNTSSPRQQQILEMWKNLGIEYMKFSDLVNMD